MGFLKSTFGQPEPLQTGSSDRLNAILGNAAQPSMPQQGNFLSRLLGVDQSRMNSIADRIGMASNRIAMSGGADPAYQNFYSQAPTNPPMPGEEQSAQPNFFSRLFNVKPSTMYQVGRASDEITRAGGAMPSYRSTY